MNLATVETWLQEHAGLVPASLGPGVVARAVRDRTADTGCAGIEEYLPRLMNDATEQQEFIDRVIVPETWFFRDRPALETLARHVVETWGPAHPGGTFRVLCVPCSTGEEPYSLAMALALANWPLARVRIEAVDISRGNLTRAREGSFGRNSFRGSELAFRDAFMTRVSADRWQVNDAVRACVTFAAGNLLAPDFATGRGSYDAVLCRNLLIYFDRPTQDRAVRVLEQLLAPGAWIAVGPAEPVLLFEHGFKALRVEGGFLLHKPPPAPAALIAPPRAKVPLPGRAPAPSLPVRPAKPAPVAPAPAQPDMTLEGMQQLADAGRLREAAEAGARLLQSDGASPALLFLIAVVAEAAGDLRRAEEFFRKTLYLAPRHTEALAHLALLAERNGDPRGARALRERAQRALQKEAV